MADESALDAALSMILAFGVKADAIVLMPTLENAAFAWARLPKTARTGDTLLALLAVDRRLTATPSAGWNRASVDHIDGRFDLHIFEKEADENERTFSASLSEPATVVAFSAAISDAAVLPVMRRRLAALPPAPT